MNEQTTEKKTYRNAPLADREYYAKPRWHEVAVNANSGNLVLTVLWDVCDRDGHAGCFDMESGVETPLPQGMDSWEAVSNTYVIAFADEAATLAKCKGKDLEYLKGVCPKTYERMKGILKWCPNWDVKRAMWFTDNKEEFYANVVRVTVVHEEWNGKMRAKAKWTNPKDRAAKEVDTTETRNAIAAKFGGFFDVKASAPAPKSAYSNHANSAPSAPQAQQNASAPSKSNKNDAWAEYCRCFSSTDTAKWFEFVKAVGKPEHDFTPEDWGSLKRTISETPNMPF